MNYLNAVFWDYPQYQDGESLRKIIQDRKNPNLSLWILTRFLEYGRVVDALGYFSLREISEQLPKLKMRPATLKKWKRILEVYGSPERR